MPTAALALGTPIASGVITVDANGDGAIGTDVSAGRADLPLGGVPLDLVCTVDGTTLASTATASDGRYEFGTGDVGACTGNVLVRLNLAGFANDQYATEKAPTAGGEAGDPLDDAIDNGLVRTGDSVGYSFSASFSQPDPRGSAASSAVFEQTLDLSGGALANFSILPAQCGSSAPASGITAQPGDIDLAAGEAPPAGTTCVTMLCNLGTIGTGTSAVFPDTSVWVSNDSPNGSTFSTTARVYGVDANDVPTIRPSADVTDGPITIVAEPRYDLAKHAYVTYMQYQTIDGVVTLGYNTYYSLTVSTDRKVGVEGPQQPITFTDIFWGEVDGSGALPAGATMPDLEYYITRCDPASDTQRVGTSVGGGTLVTNPARNVSDSGTCAPSRQSADGTSPYDITLSGIDTSGRHYPTQTINGSSLAAGPY